jgi:hypothetical protein
MATAFQAVCLYVMLVGIILHVIHVAILNTHRVCRPHVGSQGELEVIVDSDALTFVNHGCKGSNNIGVVTAFDEETANMNVMPDEVGGKSHEGTSIFNPFVDRHLTFGGCTSNRDIQAGEEILDNYLAFVSNKEDWADYVISLRNQCAGKGIGEVTEYERAH